MTTTIIRVKTSSAPPGLPVISIPDIDFTINNLPGLLEWFRADQGVSGSGAAFQWVGRKGGAILTPTGAVSPTLSNGIGGKASLGISSTGGDMYDATAKNLWPASSDYTICVVATVASGTNGVMVGTDNANHAQLQGLASTSQIAAKHQLSASANTIVTTEAFIGSPHIVTLSYDFTAKALRLFIDGILVRSASAVAVEVLPGQLRVGAAAPITSPAFGRLAGGQIAEVLTFNRALHRAENLNSLTELHNYLKSRYGL
jgi:hypothetical protein